MHLEGKQEGGGEGGSDKNALEKNITRPTRDTSFPLGADVLLPGWSPDGVLERRRLEQGAKAFTSYQPIMRSCVV